MHPISFTSPGPPPTAVPVEIRVDATCLEGELTLPPDAAGLVIFAHGCGSSHRSPRNKFVAHALQNAGWGTLLFDLLTRAEDAGDFDRRLRFDIDLLTHRLVAATRWVRMQPGVADLPCGYFGASTGAAAALSAAVQLGDEVRAIVSRGGRPDLAGAVLPSVTAPTLLIVGGWDDVVLQLNRDALHHLTCEAHLEIVPCATHLFEERGALEQVASLAADWFATHLQPAAHLSPA